MCNNKHLLLGIMLIGMLSGCATLAPSEERKVQYLEDTKVNKMTAYNRALAYLGKNFVNANNAIQVRNPDEGQIIAKTNIRCNIFKQFGDSNNYDLHFNLDLQTKDNKVRFLFEDLQMTSSDGRPLSFATNQITSKDKVDKAKECLEPAHAGVLKAINGSDKGSW